MKLPIRKESSVFRHVLSVFLALVLLTPLVGAQEYETVFAVTNARIVIGNGSVIEAGTMVLRDGLIAAVGTNVQIPAEAEVIDGSDMVIYPGFIDLHTNLGFLTDAGERGGRPEQQSGAQEETESNTREFDPNLRPDRSAIDIIDFNDDNFKAARESGITAAVTVSGRGVFPGKGSFVNTAGDDPLSALVLNDVFHFILYQQERGGYPSTLFGVVAYQRQNLIDAKYYMERENDIAKNARGALNSLKRRLVYDPVMKELFPVVSGNARVVIAALRENDIKRAVELANFENTYHLNYILSGVTEGYRVVDLLKKENRPLIVSVNFPEPDQTTGYAFNLPIKPYEPPPPSGRKAREEEEEKSEIDEAVLKQIHS
ncbi:hypothetical protein ACFL6I_29380, partial [candidate division KSB1 bacterium]